MLFVFLVVRAMFLLLIVLCVLSCWFLFGCFDVSFVVPFGPIVMVIALCYMLMFFVVHFDFLNKNKIKGKGQQRRQTR